MNFQDLVNSIDSIACVVSVEYFGDGRYGEFRLVSANQAYINSIEDPTEETGLFSKKFISDSLYTDYFNQDLNFEVYCYKSAVEKRCLHSYTQPNRSKFWISMSFIPLNYIDGNKYYCIYTKEYHVQADSMSMVSISGELASEVLNTSLKLRGSSDFQSALTDVISDIRQLCSADRCCILLIDKEKESISILCDVLTENSHLPLLKDFMDDSFYPIAVSWEDTIMGSHCLIAKNDLDMDIIKKRNPVWHRSLVDNGVSSIILFPLKYNNKLLGYVWTTNFDVSNVHTIKETLDLTTFILASEINNYLMLDRLQYLSSRDILTGVMNRNYMNDYVERLSENLAAKGESVGVIFADLNGLKRVNDEEGHLAGDRLIQCGADAIREVFNNDEIFRAGGDEFAVIVTGLPFVELVNKADELRKAADRKEGLSFAVGYAFENDAVNVRAALKRADESMYRDKKVYYHNHPGQIRKS